MFTFSLSNKWCDFVVPPERCAHYPLFYFYCLKVSEAWTPPGNAAVAIFSAVQIIVLNIYYSKLAIDLNNQENHRFVFLCALYVHDA